MIHRSPTQHQPILRGAIRTGTRLRHKHQSFPPSNGNIPASTEAGGDMAGGTFTIQSELDYSNFVGGGAELVNYFQ